MIIVVYSTAAAQAPVRPTCHVWAVSFDTFHAGSSEYGVVTEEGVALSGLFIIDKQGIIQH